jgi:hypothetical protein
MEKESVTASTRGVWHALWEAFLGGRCPATNPSRFRVRDLFQYCPEISVECTRAFGRSLCSLGLDSPNILFDPTSREVWIKFSISRVDLKAQGVSAPWMMDHFRGARSSYIEVASADRAFRTFQTATPARATSEQVAMIPLAEDIRGLNLFTHIGSDHKILYFLAVQKNLPVRLPQAVLLYTILFWLGSLVRYDPHSVAALMDSPYWILIDGFMSQSRLWLLEQFEWAIYKTETTLWLAR